MSAKLIYVMGPSGAGKDSLIRWVMENKSASMKLHWAKRLVTRHWPQGEGCDEHVSLEAFEKLLESQTLGMHWFAHDIHYGILDCELMNNPPDALVLINGSRAYFPKALELYPQLLAIHITASASTLEQRLNQRARESEDQISLRLTRPQLVKPKGDVPWLDVLNEGDLKEGGQQILSFLSARNF